MAQTATLHVKLDPMTNRRLKDIAHARHVSKGELVREAISACYQVAIEELPLQQRRAIAAYEGGFVSIGKLAQVMGMNVLDLRQWLREHEISQNSMYSEQDAANA